MTSAILTDGLMHRYGQRTALCDLSFSVGHGEVVALLGPNGSGKSTLAKILSTLLPPTAGRASICGHCVVRESAAVRRRIGVTFQSPSIDVKLTLEENLHYHGRMYGLHGAALRTRVDESLAEFDLADRRRERAEVLSGGLRRRLEIAKALLHQPDMLLLDEPSTGLDPRARRALIELLDRRRARSGTTCLLATHLMDEAQACDRVAILDQGRLVAMDTPSNLCRAVGGEVVTVHPCRTDTAAGGGDAERLRAAIAERFSVAAAQVAGVIRIEREDGHAFAARMAEAFGERVESISVGRPTLEDVFVRLTGHRFEDDGDVGT
ncbi:MAG: ABC transporter ATP-binding protein [Phycisphaerales bacterium]|nr:MAG: ABC transporter ATP-binding protein [Phycisphaerales bacterium]